MIIFLRLLPFLVGLLQVATFRYQLMYPSTYPWVVAVGCAAVPLAAFAICWGSLGTRDMANKMVPTFLTLGSLAFGLLLVEGRWQAWLVTCLAALISFISLELLFLLVYDPVAYPVHGISRANVGYVPIAVWYAASTSFGLMTFLHSQAVWHVALMAVLGVVLFRTTGHQDSTRDQSRTWAVIGVLVGLEVGLAGAMLPIGMQAQGLLAAVVFSAALRARRYLYQPKPSRVTAYAEGVAVLVVFIAGLATATWI